MSPTDFAEHFVDDRGVTHDGVKFLLSVADDFARIEQSYDLYCQIRRDLTQPAMPFERWLALSQEWRHAASALNSAASNEEETAAYRALFGIVDEIYAA